MCGASQFFAEPARQQPGPPLKLKAMTPLMLHLKKLPLAALLVLPLLCAAQARATEPWGAAATVPATPPTQASPMPMRGAEAPEQLRDKLKITPAQQPLWDAYVARLDAYTQQFFRERPALASDDEAAPQQITRLVMNHQNRLAGLEDIEQAAKALYSALDADQKKMANLWLLASIPTFTGPPAGAANNSERRPDMRQGGDMRRRGGGGMGGMGSGRY
jgi:hypothetical protein